MDKRSDYFGRAADAMSAADLARIYPARRVMDPGTEPMSRKGYTGHPVASPHATEVPDQGEGLTDTAAQLLHMQQRSPAGAYGDDGSAVREAPPMSGAANAPDDDTA